MSRSPLRKSPGKGTLVDTWTYDATLSVGEGDEQKTQVRKVSVELRLIKDFDDLGEGTPLATKGVRFTVTCKDVDLSLEGTDIETLRLAMWERLDERYRIKWEGWLLVRVDPRSPYEGTGAGFVFSHQNVERGVAFDGSVLLREYVPHGKGYRISPWPEQFKERNGKTLACIPASKENLKALDEFGRRIDAMRRQLAEFVKPDAILNTLANIRESMAQVGGAGSAARIAPPRALDEEDGE